MQAQLSSLASRLKRDAKQRALHEWHLLTGPKQQDLPHCAGIRFDTQEGVVRQFGGQSMPLAGARASVEASGQLDKRVTVTRFVLTGPFAFALRKKNDSRKLYLTVEGETGVLLAVLAGIAIPTASQARAHHQVHHKNHSRAPYLTVGRSYAAIQSYAAKQGGTTGSCWRISAGRVACGVLIPVVISFGPATATATATIVAFLRDGAGPYLERVGGWSLAISTPTS